VVSRFRSGRTLPLLGLTLIAIGFASAANPLLAAGVVLGVAVIAATLAWPLTVVGIMLALGPIDLSGITGGVRGLLPALGGFDMSGIRLAAISAGLGTVVLTRRDLLGSLLAGPARWYTLFLLWGTATLAFSPAPLEGVRLLFKIGYPLLLFVVVAAPERTPAEVRRLADWALWGAVGILLANPFVVANGGYAVEAGQDLRVEGPGSHFNPFSFYLLTILVLSMARFRTRGQSRYLLLGGVAVIWMALTLTRITFLASLIAMAVFAVYVAIMDRSLRTLLAVAGAALLIGALVLRGVLDRTFGYVPTLGQLVSLASDPVALYNAINWQGRETLWGILWIVFARSPVVGSGLGAASAALIATLGEGAPHNEYLRIAVDVGVVGVVLYALAVLAWGRAALAAARAGRRYVVCQEMAMPALALLIAWAVISMTDNAFDYYGPFTQYIAFLCGACVAVVRTAEAPVEATPALEALGEAPAR
jgi:O-antigen ligase